MNKKTFLILIIFFFIASIVYAKAITPKPGTINKFKSQNGIFLLEIKIIGYPDSSPSEGTFKKGKEILWTKKLPTTPGFVDISNNGNYFVLANWGRYDEGGYKSISFYNGKGEILKTIEFDSSKEKLRWLRKTCITSDGNYYLISSPNKNVSEVILYFVPTQKIIWNKSIGLEQIDNVIISKSGDFILLSTFDYTNHDIACYYLNKDGNVLWNRTIERGHAWNKDIIWISDDGREFKYLNILEKKWFLFENAKNKIIFKKIIPDNH